ncbi:MAG: flavodoxin-dependent (E)-4-hydroxy-3-methylbut-2-enyl-diphosphate synthase [Actinomycetota bacterium]|nr:flavodoxin-dependent (E)-4-hydroxy-3-methylbut-2-enyl-diphosphate synthase [Actinomycetota bacterium]
MSFQRRHSKKITIGNVEVGGNAPVRIQSMTTTKTEDVHETLVQAHAIATQGGELVRVAVPHEGDARALSVIVREAGVPIIADIHFSYRLALMALEAGVHGLRLNPGNIRNSDQIRTVVREAASRRVPIRVGVNAGSLDRRLLAKYGGPTPAALVASALEEIKILEDEGFVDIKISVKHQRVPQMIEAYRLLAGAVDYPLHLGVTEAGPPPYGTLKSAVGIGTLLAEGIGDTIRVSLTADPVEEVKVAKQILQALGLRRSTFDLVACPSCGRAELDVMELTKQVQERLEQMKLPPIQIAVMGCEVNGPGEAREADVGIAAGPGRGLLFSKGKQIGWVPADKMVDALMEEAVKVAKDKSTGLIDEPAKPSSESPPHEENGTVDRPELVAGRRA